MKMYHNSLKRIEKFEDFVSRRDYVSDPALREQLNILEALLEQEDLSEGWKETAIAVLVSLLVGGTVDAQKIKDLGTVKTGQGKEVTTTKEYTFNLDKMPKEKADRIIDGVLEMGWKRTSSEMDTVWKEVRTKAPETQVATISVRFDENVFYKSGEYKLNDSIKADLNTALQSVVDDNGVLTSVRIISSTDKQGLSKGLQERLKADGFSPDNQGLSKARSFMVKEYLVDQKEIGDTLVVEENLFEQGKEEIDQSSRFVIVYFTYLVENAPAESRVEKEPTVRYVVRVEKTYKPKIVKLKFKGKYKKTDNGQIEKFPKREAVPCAIWD